MSDNDFTILDEEEKKEQRDGGTEKEKSHELTASEHGKRMTIAANMRKSVLSVTGRRALQAR